MYGRGVRDPLPGATGAVAGEVGGLDDLSELHELVCGDVTLDEGETALQVAHNDGDLLKRDLSRIGEFLVTLRNDSQSLDFHLNIHSLTSVGVSLVGVVAAWGCGGPGVSLPACATARTPRGSWP